MTNVASPAWNAAERCRPSRSSSGAADADLGEVELVDEEAAHALEVAHVVVQRLDLADAERLELRPWLLLYSYASAASGCAVGVGRSGTPAGAAQAASTRTSVGQRRERRRRSGARRRAAAPGRRRRSVGASPTRNVARRRARAVARAPSSPRAMKWRAQALGVAAELVLDALRSSAGSAAAGCPSSRSRRAGAPARAAADRAGSSGGAGSVSSRYSRIAIDCASRSGASARSSSSSTGTCASGLSARYAVACCSPPSGDQVHRHVLVRRRPSGERDAHAPRRRCCASRRRASCALTTSCSMRPKRLRAVGVEHLDRDGVARLHERRLRLAAVSMISMHAPLGEARDAARAIGVRHRAAAEDRAGGEARACARCARRDRKNEKCISGPRRDRRPARRCSVVRRRRCTRPSRHAPPELVGRDRERRERRRRLRLEEAEALGQLGGDRLRSVTSLASMHAGARAPPRRRRACRAACRRGSRRPRPRSRAPTPASASGMSSRRRRAARPSRPGRPADRVRSVSGGSAPRALRTSITWFR